MTSEAESRPLRARLAPSGTPRERASAPDPVNGRRAAARRSEVPADEAPHGANGTNGANGSNGSRGTGNDDAELAAVVMPAAHPAHAAHTLIHDDPLAALLDEAQAAVSNGANALRDVRERYRSAYLEKVERWETLRARTNGSGVTGATSGGIGGGGIGGGAATDEAVAGREVGVERSVLGRIDLAAKSLENAWLFLAREDTSLVSDPSGPPSAADAQMRIVEAQEQERTRLAREVHDGPAQALSNAIFQVEVVQRLLDRDERLARAELKQLREVLTRELRGVRAYLSQLRPPLLADLGLSGAIREAGDQIASALNVPVTVELEDGVDQLPETVEVVALRVIQEALQNARKHAQPTSIRVRMYRDGAGWSVEVRDDGKGFDADDPPVSGRRHFGLQFMRERAELIGARFEVRSSPNLGTAVRMTIPPGAMGMPIPGEEHR